MVYTALTFAPVQGFIEKSRKLRDLYGSSFILSFLAKQVCDEANNLLDKDGKKAVVSPALLNVAQGTPNQIVIAGDFPEKEAKAALDGAWHKIVDTCRQWIEGKIPGDYAWEREWNAWKNHAWEFFWGQGNTVTEAREAANRSKYARNWTGINWMGESSTLSGTDAIAWPGMGRIRSARDIDLSADDREIRRFYEQLSAIQGLGEAFVDASEQLSIPELVKRLVTYAEVAKKLDFAREIPKSFRQTGKSKAQKFWFQGDGDRIGEYLQSLTARGNDEAKVLHEFSSAMMQWGENTLKREVDGKSIGSQETGRIIYAGGDDFLGVIYNEDDDPKQFSPYRCLQWFCTFPQIWAKHGQQLTVSVGAVLASPQVPQRDVLQHCREAENSAKKSGRDRLALRVLFGSGNYIEWVCPWWFLPNVFAGYRDRNGVKDARANWGHFFSDVVTLEARHGFEGNQTEVALSLFELYFGADNRRTLAANLWDRDESSPQLRSPEGGATREKRPGILGNEKKSENKEAEALNDWIISLAKVGFQLCSNT